MVRLLSWNIHSTKKGLSDALKEALPAVLNENDIDIVVLQEAYGGLLQAIMNTGTNSYEELTSLDKMNEGGVRIFVKQNVFEVLHVSRSLRNKLVIGSLKKIGGADVFNIAGVHFHSKVGNTERQQLWKNYPLLQSIEKYEKDVVQQTNTIMVGDFNHNPYEANMCDPYFFWCNDSRDIMSRLASSKRQNDKMWYNPMWNLLGDYDYMTKTAKVTGTYYQNSSSEKPFWNLFDGVILRSSLMDKIDYDRSAIIAGSQSMSFIKPFSAGAGDSLIREDISDHLPVKFTLLLN